MNSHMNHLHCKVIFVCAGWVGQNNRFNNYVLISHLNSLYLGAVLVFVRAVLVFVRCLRH